jgi:hypothetical protein
LLKFFLKFEKGRESLEDCPKLVMKDQNTKWKNWRTRMYKIDKISDSILMDKRLIWWKYFYLG